MGGIMRPQLRPILAVLYLVATGCVTVKDVNPRQILMTDNDGMLVDPTGNIRCESNYPCNGQHTQYRRYRAIDPGSVDPYTREMLNALETARVARPDKHLNVVIFVHGGLNTQLDTIKRAAALGNAMPNGTVPIFVNWQSSLLSSYADHVFRIRQGSHWPRFGWVFSPVYFASDVVRAIARAPFVCFFLLVDMYHSVGAPLTLSLDKPYMDPERLGNTQSGTSDDEYWRTKGFDVAVGDDHLSDGERWGLGTIAVATLPTKLITAPIIDAFGTSSWEAMKRALHVQFHDRSYELESDGQMDGPAATFFRALVDHIHSTGEENWTITMVGHSMGALVMNEIIRYYGDGLPIKKIVYMAAACPLHDYEDTVWPYLRRWAKKRNPQMYHLTLHPKAEIREKQTMLGFGVIDWVPRGSLLVWIDSFLSQPNTVADRTAGRYRNLRRALLYTPEDIRDRLHVRVFDAKSSSKIEPQRHADFGSIRFWDERCWTSKPYPEMCMLPNEKGVPTAESRAN
jgi:pimeloyl-ACP methyl ester carboxylesterase